MEFDAGRKALLGLVVGRWIQPDSIPLVTVIQESWYYNCCSGGTAKRGSLCVRAEVIEIQDSSVPNSTNSVFVARIAHEPNHHLPLFLLHSALRKDALSAASLALCW